MQFKICALLLRRTLISIKKHVTIYLLILFITCGQAFAQNVNILVNPATTNTSVGANFVVTVRVDFISGGSLDAARVYLPFNNTILNVVSVTKTSALPIETYPLDPVATMNTNGFIKWIAGTTSNFPAADFDLLTITFNVIQAPAGGSTPLNFGTVFPNNTTAARSGVFILNSLINGTVTTCTAPALTIANTGTCNGQPFNLFVNNSTAGTGPFDITVNGVTYNDITPGASGTFLSVFPANEKIWPGNPTPATPTNNDGLPIETGVKFRSSVAGFVKGVRFYLGANTAGTYTGKLYTGGGALEAQRNFTSVTANGWQEITFTTPVAIPINTTYVASVYSSAGNYAQTDFGMVSATTTGNLTALADGTDGVNGVYLYGNGFPTNTWVGHSPNYWIDVLFTPANFTYNLTSITDATGCVTTGSPIQALNVTSVDCSTLPVTLLNLSATPENKNVRLRWSTATEIDNKGFEIQRSTNGSTWEGIGYVNGAGNSSITQNYSYLDQGLFPRRYYYRLKQEDIDGKYKYSMVVAVLLEGKGEFSLGQNYPNPFRTVTTIPYTLAERTQVSLTVYDMNGRVIKTLVNEKRDAGTHAENFHVGGLPSGLYYYKIQAGSFTAVKKLVLN
jgi:hypothetical protein